LIVTRVTQTETALGRGNCLAACVASLLDLPLEDVPNFRLAGDSWTAMQGWLQSRGLQATEIATRSARMRCVPKDPCILVGNSPRNPVYHAVIGLCDNGTARVIHDPHPDGTGLAGPPVSVIVIRKVIQE
jgi:hypothetical protein